MKGTGITVNALAPSIITTRANHASMPGVYTTKWVTEESIAELCVPPVLTVSRELQRNDHEGLWRGVMTPVDFLEHYGYY